MTETTEESEWAASELVSLVGLVLRLKAFSFFPFCVCVFTERIQFDCGKLRATYRLGERINTVIYSFDKNSPRISAFGIHEWIRETVHREEQEVPNIQVDGQMRQVYIKL
jgi:hypothetical protein